MKPSPQPHRIKLECQGRDWGGDMMTETANEVRARLVETCNFDPNFNPLSS